MTSRTERLAYLPGVDGLRAISVLAVFLFHAGVLNGGFIGVPDGSNVAPCQREFDYANWLCPDYDCAASSDLRADKVHFSDIEPLRRGVLDAILAQVVPIAGY